MKQRQFLILLFFIISCEQVQQPLPKGYLRLEYPEAGYSPHSSAYPFSFEHNQLAKIIDDKRGIKLVYPKMNATLYLNYKSIKENLNALLNDAYQLPYKHAVKATSITEKLFIDPNEKVYGTLFSVEGDAASQFQFFVTDSTRHYLIGSLYFYAQPNYDSLYPAIQYLRKDLTHFMETLKWD